MGLWNFIQRHKRKLAFVGAAIGAGYFAVQYGRRKYQEMQDQEASKCLNVARKRHHFDSNLRTCNMTVLSMLSTIRTKLLQVIDTEALTEQLKSKPSNKVEIWEQLKILSFTRSICTVYILGMLVSLLRIQLNIIGGYMYIDELPNEGGEPKSVIASPQVQSKYLENINYMLGPGLTELVKKVREIITELLEKKSLKEQLSLNDVNKILTQVRQKVEIQQESSYDDSPNSILCKYMFPVGHHPENAAGTGVNRDDVVLAHLMKETSDVVKSPDFQSVLTTCLDTGFACLENKMAEHYRSFSGVELAEGSFVNPYDVQMPLAKVIPVMNGLIHSLCCDAPNVFAQELLLKEEVKDFSANVYEAFSQPGHGHQLTLL